MPRLIAAVGALFLILPSMQYAQTADRSSHPTLYARLADNTFDAERKFSRRQEPITHVNVASGFQWTTPVAIDTSTPNVSQQYFAAMAVDDTGNLAVVWTEVRNGGGIQIVAERSTNKGLTWIRSVPFPFAYGRQTHDIAFDHQGNLWLLWSSWANEFAPYYLNLSKSTDYGQTFSTLFTSMEYAAPFFEPKVAIDNSNNLFMLWDDQQFKLTRFANGNLGQRIDTEIPNDTLRVDFWCSLAVGPGTNVYCIWTGIRRLPSGQDMYKVYCSASTDTGRTFAVTTRVDTTEYVGLYSAQRYPRCAADSSGAIYVSYSRQTDINTLGLLVATSLDGGNTFRAPVSILEPGFNTNPSICVDATTGIDISWAGDGGTFFSRSTDVGQTFSDPVIIGGGLSDLDADRAGGLFTTLDTHRRAIMFAKTNVLAKVKEAWLNPQQIGLSQNYPNPFNPLTTIEYSLPEGIRVNLKVYDVLGREVLTLVDDFVVAGNHQATFDAGRLASGVYFYRLQAGNFIDTKKLLLLK